MSKIVISNLQSISLNRHSDLESYLNELNETEKNIQGGYILHVAFAIGFAIGYNL
jgi:hypothetical protein